MKKALIVTIVILSCIQINAQSLTGLVYDKDTKQPISGVYVYLNGTSIMDVTENSGKFSLPVKQMINTNLVFSHLAYHTLIIENPFMNLPDTIYMEERSITLSEVIVRPQFTRQQRLRAFREQFLGMTRAGRSCKILNEDDIQTWFHVPTQTLFASSDKPIEVINEYLGYKVLFELVDFKVEYSNISLARDKIQQSYFAVATLFVDLKPDDRRTKRRRDGVYERSSALFFRNFSNNTLNESGFKIYKNSLPIDYHNYFTIEDTLSLKIIRLIPERANISSHPSVPMSTFSVLFNRRQTDISLYADSLLVDQYGNIDQIDKVVFRGAMGQNRAGDMLPIEYEP